MDISRKQIISSVVAATLLAAALPVAAADPELEELKAQIRALQERVVQLEEGNDRQTDQIAQTRANVPAWVPNFAWKGDFRYRNEDIQQDGSPDRNRDRIRARAGFTAKVNDTVRTELMLSTADEASPANARSSNQTLGAGNSRKPVYVDTAYVEWQPLPDWKFTAGKMKYPWVRPGQSVLFDGDVNPEGLAVNYAHGGFFASGFYNDLAERAAAKESRMAGGQLGWKGSLGINTFTVGASYFGLTHVKGYGDTANLLVAGNTTRPTGCVLQAPAGTACFANDFDIIEGFAEASRPLAGRPLAVYVDYAKNDAATNGLDSAWSAGVQYGKASEPRSWEIGYMFQEVQKDALFGAYIDSDWGAGNTDFRGSAVKFGYAIAKNWVFNAMYQFSDIALTGTRRDYQRLQLDLNFKY
jgi:hypothetical protein